MQKYKSPAVKRYTKRLAVLMIVYVISIFGVGFLFKAGAVSGYPAFALAVVPALPIIGVFWAVMRLVVEEPDEYMRLMFVRQIMIATAFCLTIMTIWEFLQNFDLVPQGTGGFGTAFFWFMGLGVGAFANWILRDKGEEEGAT